MAAHEEMLKYG